MASRTPRSRGRRRPRSRRAVAARPALANALERTQLDLDAVGARYALVGGLAVSARAEPRLTRDVDVAVAVDRDTEAEAILQALARRGYTLTAVVEQTRTKRLATARLRTPDGRIVLDLLFVSCGIERQIVAEAELLEVLPGLQLPVAQSAHLIAMKILAHERRRPQDIDDIRALLAVADTSDRKRVVQALSQIQASGFARRRDLLTLWRKLQR